MAVRTSSMAGGKQRTTVFMHREIVNTPKGVETDHEDGDSLNNQKYNLRPATSQENKRGFRRKAKGTTSCYRGVSWQILTSKWIASIRVDGVLIHLGRFAEESVAAKAYDTAAIQHFGKFTQLNFKN